MKRDELCEYKSEHRLQVIRTSYRTMVHDDETEATMENQIFDYYLLKILLIKLSILSLIKLLKFAIGIHSTYKKSLKKKYSAEKNQHSKVAEIIVHGSIESNKNIASNEKDNLTKIIVHKPSDLHSSITPIHHPDLSQ